MSKVLRISPDLSLPLDVVTSTLVIYGGKGMGKTNLGSVIVEEFTKAGLRWCYLDPMGVAWGLRHSSDGTGPGVECVILGGVHGDIPIEPTGGAIVADLVIDEGVNTIIDFSRHPNGTMWSAGERVRFVTDYTKRLFERQGSLVDGKRREPLMQILDEAARYIPQVIPAGAVDLAKCVGAWEQVCEEGRNIGLGVTFLTQRSARMNKSVSELADVMIAFRTIGPRSLDAVMDWLGDHVEKKRVNDLAAKVRELNIGQALVVSPGWLRVEKIAQVRKRETFDSSATPKSGQKPQRVTGKAAKPDLARYQVRMAATIEKVKADDPNVLRKKIAELEKSAKAQRDPKLSASRVEVDQAYRDGYEKGKEYATDKVVNGATAKVRHDAATMRKQYDGRIQAIARGSGKLIGALRAALTGWEVVCGDTFGGPVIELPSTTPVPSVKSSVDLLDHQKRPAQNAPVTVVKKIVENIVSDELVRDDQEGRLAGPELRIVDAIAWFEAIGVKPANQAGVAFLAGYSGSSNSAYKNPRARLKVRQLVEYHEGDRISLTGAGALLASAEAKEGAGTTAELHQRVLAKLGGPEQKILKPLLAAYPDSIDNDTLARQANYSDGSNSAYKNPRARLRSFGLVEYETGRVIAADFLFLDR